MLFAHMLRNFRHFWLWKMHLGKHKEGFYSAKSSGFQSPKVASEYRCWDKMALDIAWHKQTKRHSIFKHYTFSGWSCDPLRDCQGQIQTHRSSVSSLHRSDANRHSTLMSGTFSHFLHHCCGIIHQASSTVHGSNSMIVRPQLNHTSHGQFCILLSEEVFSPSSHFLCVLSGLSHTAHGQIQTKSPLNNTSARLLSPEF